MSAKSDMSIYRDAGIAIKFSVVQLMVVVQRRRDWQCRSWSQFNRLLCSCFAECNLREVTLWRSHVATVGYCYLFTAYVQFLHLLHLLSINLYRLHVLTQSVFIEFKIVVYATII